MPPLIGQWRQLRDFPAEADVAIGPYEKWVNLPCVDDIARRESFFPAYPSASFASSLWGKDSASRFQAS